MSYNRKRTYKKQHSTYFYEWQIELGYLGNFMFRDNYEKAYSEYCKLVEERKEKDYFIREIVHHKTRTSFFDRKDGTESYTITLSSVSTKGKKDIFYNHSDSRPHVVESAKQLSPIALETIPVPPIEPKLTNNKSRVNQYINDCQTNRYHPIANEKLFRRLVFWFFSIALLFPFLMMAADDGNILFLTIPFLLAWGLENPILNLIRKMTKEYRMFNKDANLLNEYYKALRLYRFKLKKEFPSILWGKYNIDEYEQAVSDYNRELPKQNLRIRYPGIESYDYNVDNYLLEVAYPGIKHYAFDIGKYTESIVSTVFMSKENIYKRDWWMSLDGYQFEEAVAEWYRKKGWSAKTTKKSNDGGIDIVVSKNGITANVQCKHYKSSSVGRPIAQALLGTVADASSFANEAHIVCLHKSSVTKECDDFMKKNSMRLITIDDLCPPSRVKACNNDIDPNLIIGDHVVVLRKIYANDVEAQDGIMFLKRIGYSFPKIEKCKGKIVVWDNR